MSRSVSLEWLPGKEKVFQALAYPFMGFTRSSPANGRYYKQIFLRRTENWKIRTQAIPLTDPDTVHRVVDRLPSAAFRQGLSRTRTAD